MWRNEQIYRRIGLVPEREAMYDVVTGWEFVLANARLHRLDDPEAAARRALETVEMTDAQGRDISTYSKGMKQRVKMATALVHDPPVLLLDEPFNGMDPRQRLHLMTLLQRMAEQGRTVLFSSHILEEVEQIAGSIEVMVSGRHAASGGFREIRQLMTERPHQYTIRSDDDRRLASAIIAEPSTSGVQLIAAHGTEGFAARGAPSTGSRDGSSALHVQAVDFSAFVRVLPELASQPRHPALRGDAGGRVAGERVRLPGGPMNATVARLTARSLLGRRRAYLLMALPGVLIAAVRPGLGCSPGRTTTSRSASWAASPSPRWCRCSG